MNNEELDRIEQLYGLTDKICYNKNVSKYAGTFGSGGAENYRGRILKNKSGSVKLYKGE